MKNIMFIAPPAAGKGTQAEIITAKYNIPHISTGDILREIAKEDSEIGNYVAETMASGKLVKDEITYQLIEERLSREDCRNGYIIDGFPRNLDQAIEYDKILAKLGVRVGEITKDGKWIVTSCRCLGCCGLAPAITINGEVYGKLKVEDIDKIVDSYAD